LKFVEATGRYGNPLTLISAITGTPYPARSCLPLMAAKKFAMEVEKFAVAVEKSLSGDCLKCGIYKHCSRNSGTVI
jgi:hypothetical protein